MAQNVLVVSLRLNNIFQVGIPCGLWRETSWGPTHGGLIRGAEELHPSLGCPTHGGCPKTEAGGLSQPRERCKRTRVGTLSSSLGQQLVALWGGLWRGAGRGAGLLALCTLPEQLFPIFSGGKRHGARQRPPAARVWPADPSWSLLS